MKKIALAIIFLLFAQTTLATSIFDDLKESKKNLLFGFHSFKN